MSIVFLMSIERFSRRAKEYKKLIHISNIRFDIQAPSRPAAILAKFCSSRSPAQSSPAPPCWNLWCDRCKPFSVRGMRSSALGQVRAQGFYRDISDVMHVIIHPCLVPPTLTEKGGERSASAIKKMDADAVSLCVVCYMYVF